jgi:hypothetical protein
VVYENAMGPGLFMEKSMLNEKIIFHWQGTPQILVLQKYVTEVL